MKVIKNLQKSYKSKKSYENHFFDFFHGFVFCVRAVIDVRGH